MQVAAGKRNHYGIIAAQKKINDDDLDHHRPVNHCKKIHVFLYLLLILTQNSFI
jgi:hypothetical protein